MEYTYGAGQLSQQNSSNVLGDIPSQTTELNEPSLAPKKNNKKTLKIVGAVFALLLVVGVAVGSYLFSNRLRTAEVPTAPSSAPQASGCPAGMVSNGVCEAGGVAISVANCCKLAATTTVTTTGSPTATVTTTVGGVTSTPVPTLPNGLGSCPAGQHPSMYTNAAGNYIPPYCIPNDATNCVDTTWVPQVTNMCANTTFTQSSNCGRTREAMGTKTVGCSANPSGKVCPTGQHEIFNYNASGQRVAPFCAAGAPTGTNVCTTCNGGTACNACSAAPNQGYRCECTGAVTGGYTSCVGKLDASCNGAPTGTIAPTGSCSVKYYFAITTSEDANGENLGVCKPTTDTYDTNNNSCKVAGQTCTGNLRASLPIELQGMATCHPDKSSCDNAGGNTGFRYYYNANIKKCASTNHRYDTNEKDVDDINHRTCVQNIDQWDGIKNGVCYKSMLECNNAQTTCTDTTWTPDPALTCTGTNVTQTSNCGKTRVVGGTKDCSTSTGDAELSLTKKAYKDESSNTAGNYTLTTEIDKVSRDQVFVYAFEIENTGTNTATNVQLVDILKGGKQELLTLVDAESRCKYATSTRTVTCSGMSLAAGKTGTYTFRVKVSNTAVNGETITNVGVVSYKEMPTGGEIEDSVDLLISTIVGCNNVCTSDDECVAGLSCDPSTERCRRPSCSDASTCNCPVAPTEQATAAPTRVANVVTVAARQQQAVLPQTGILDFPGVATFGGGLLLAIVGILLAL